MINASSDTAAQTEAPVVAAVLAQPHPRSASMQFLHQVLVEITCKLKADASQFAVYEAANDVFVSYALSQDGKIVPHPDGFPVTIQASGSGFFEILKDIHTPRRFYPETEPHQFWPGTVEYHRSAGTRVVYAVPLHFGDRFAGFLGLAFKYPYVLAPADLPAVEALARQAAIAAELIRLAKVETQAILDRAQELAAAERAAASDGRARMLNAIVRASRDLQNADDFEIGLSAWLQRVAGAAGADAAGLGQYYFRGADNRAVPRIRATWSSRPMPRTGPEEGGDNEVPPTSDFTEWTAQILRGEIVCANRRDLKDPASRKYWDDEGCAGHVLVPVQLAGESRGFLSFDFFTEQPRDNDIMVAIQTAAEGLGAALRRQAVQEALLAERDARVQELQRTQTALQRTIDVLQDVDDVDQIVPRVLGIVAETFGADSCAAFENDPDGLVRLKYWHVGGRTMTPSQLRESDHLDHETIDVLQVLAEGFRVPDLYFGMAAQFAIGTFPLDHRRGTDVPEFDRFCVKNGWDLELNIGVSSQGRRRSTLTILRPAERPFTAAEQALGESLAKQIALAIGMARLAFEARQAALAMERQTAVRERAAELARVNEALRRSVSRLVESADIGSALLEALRTVVEVCAAEGGTIGRYLPSERGFRTAFQIVDNEVADGLVPAYEDRLYSLEEPAVALTWEVFHRSGAVLWCALDSPYLTEDTREYLWQIGGTGIILAPLMRGSECTGYLGLFSRSTEPLLPGQQELVRALSDQIALMLELTRLAESDKETAVLRERERASRVRADELEKANQVLKQTLDVACSEPNLKRVLGHVLRAITQQLRSNSSALWLFDEQSNRFKAHLVWHEQQIVEVDGESAQPVPSAWGRGRDLVFKDHIQARKPVIYDVEKFRHDNPVAYEYFMRRGVHALLGIPLLMGEDVVGSLTVRFATPQSLAEEDLALTQAMAHQATMAIQLTRLAEQARMAAIADERTRFARDVHDTLAQGFTGILMQLGAASQVAGCDREGIAPQLAAIGALARSSLDEARSSVRALRQLSVTEGPFEHRLDQLLGSMRPRTQAEILLKIFGRLSHLQPYVQNELLGIVRESITNAIKHAKAKVIQVCVEVPAPTSIRVSVKDDGIGFDSAELPAAQRFGLIGMQERAATIGASLTIVTDQGRGTEVIVQYGQPGLPL